MFKFFKRDPLERAKKHVDKALEELEEGYPDYASDEFEKASLLFLEANHVDFAIKYYREAAYAALENNDHARTAEMKIAAADLLLADGVFAEGGGLYAEASDHLYRDKKYRSANDALSSAVICYLAARAFDTAINLFKKADKRSSTLSGSRGNLYNLASLCVKVLCEGDDVQEARLNKVLGGVKASAALSDVINFVVSSVKIAMQTDVIVDWAGPPIESVPAKTPIELELHYSCPVSVKVVDYRLPLSNSLTFIREPEIGHEASPTGSWLIVLNPVLSGDGVVGPFRMTLEGDQVLVNKHSNRLEFRIDPAPAQLELDMSPRRIDCSLGDEVVIDIALKNTGDGPANNIHVDIDLSDNLDLSIGGRDKIIQFIGAGETMRFQVYVRGEVLGEGIVTVKVTSGKDVSELVESGMVNVI
ncbi:MAG: hypothetical protein ACTSYL_03895 [Candidatus Thorarchaeota archaeon]